MKGCKQNNYCPECSVTVDLFLHFFDPNVVFVEAIVIANELLPEQSSPEPVLFLSFDAVDDILEIPGWAAMLVFDFEFEEAKTNFVC